MKRELLLVFLFVGGTYSLYAQQTAQLKLVRTEPNGVQVFESTGVEKNQISETVNPPSRSMNDWNKEECENALYFINLKIDKMKETEGNELLIQDYEAQKARINERMNSLISTH